MEDIEETKEDCLIIDFKREKDNASVVLTDCFVLFHCLRERKEQRERIEKLTTDEVPVSIKEE